MEREGGERGREGGREREGETEVLTLMCLVVSIRLCVSNSLAPRLLKCNPLITTYINPLITRLPLALKTGVTSINFTLA